MVLKRFCLLLLLLALLAVPRTVFAHASLQEALPAPDSVLDAAPPQIQLTFGERLEKRLYFIRVYNNRGNSVTSREAEMSADQRQLILRLPRLADGSYTVSYKVVSADGHPVSGSYVITIGPAGKAEPSPDFQNPAGGHEHGSASHLEYWAVRIFYYFSLLALAGWTLWNAGYRPAGEAVNKLRRDWSRHFLWFFLITLAGTGLLQIADIMSGWSWSGLVSLLTGTAFGLSWLCSLALGFLGTVTLGRSCIADIVWTVLLLAAKSFSGHAMAFEPVWRTVALDFLHLLAASVWTGGLLFVFLTGRRHREEWAEFLPRFSRASLLSFLLLAATGAASAWIFVPKPGYLLLTAWGRFLLAKIVLVILVAAAAARIRSVMRHRGTAAAAPMVAADLVLMAGIVAVAGIFTYLSPSPANEPLHWHVMGSRIHMTAEISPNAPGKNSFRTVVWLPEGSPPPKQVQMTLSSADKPDIGAIKVPLSPQQGTDEAGYFTGFDSYRYECYGPYLPFPGRWKVEVRVMDAKDEETVYDKTITVY
jgi:copper transport protein